MQVVERLHSKIFPKNKIFSYRRRFKKKLKIFLNAGKVSTMPLMLQMLIDDGNRLLFLIYFSMYRKWTWCCNTKLTIERTVNLFVEPLQKKAFSGEDSAILGVDNVIQILPVSMLFLFKLLQLFNLRTLVAFVTFMNAFLGILSCLFVLFLLLGWHH